MFVDVVQKSLLTSVDIIHLCCLQSPSSQIAIHSRSSKVLRVFNVLFLQPESFTVFNCRTVIGLFMCNIAQEMTLVVP